MSLKYQLGRVRTNSLKQLPCELAAHYHFHSHNTICSRPTCCIQSEVDISLILGVIELAGVQIVLSWIPLCLPDKEFKKTQVIRDEYFMWNYILAFIVSMLYALSIN